MSDNEILEVISVFPSTTGIRFDLLADFELKHFFIKFNQLWKSACRSIKKDPSKNSDEFFKAQFEGIFHATIKEFDGTHSEEVISIENLKKALPNNMMLQMRANKFIPFEIFNAVLTPFPKLTTRINNPVCIFCTNEENVDERIAIFNCDGQNFVKLHDLNHLLTGDYKYYSPQFIKAVCLYNLFVSPIQQQYYIALSNVTSFLNHLDNSQFLQWRFNLQVFMKPTPHEEISGNWNLKWFSTVSFKDCEFHIYQGNGFAENRFFFKVDNLAELLGVDTECSENALDDTIFVTGCFWQNNENFCRLNYATYITRHYLARLWNGENENNDRIKNGWAFISWFNNFLPKFLKENVEYWCGGQWFPNFDYAESTQYTPITHEERNFIANFIDKSRSALTNLAETLKLAQKEPLS